jgi:hypothetical protein
MMCPRLTWGRGIRIALALTCFCHSIGSASGEPAPQDGFCGFHAAQASVTRLGMKWKQTKPTKILEEAPLSSFHQIADALQSLNLKTEYVLLEKSNQGDVRRLISEVSPRVTAITWLDNALDDRTSSLEGVGHFICVLGINDKDEVVLEDAQSHVISEYPLQNYRTLPLLLVSESDIAKDTVTGSWSVRFRAAFSTITTSLALITLGAILLSRKRYSLKDEAISKTKHPSRRRKFVAAGLLVVLLLSGGILAFVSWKTNSVVTQQGSKLRLFSKPSFDLGVMVIGAVDPVTISITNPHDQPIEISRLYPSCGCINVDPPQVVLAPGQTLPVKLQFSTFLAGENLYKIYAEHDGKTLDTAELTFSGKASATLVPRRKHLGVIRVGSRTALEQSLSIKEYSGPTLASCNLRPSGPESPLKISLQSDDGLSANSEMKLMVSLKPGTKVRGMYHEELVFDLAPKEDSLKDEQLHMIFSASIEIVE